MNIPKGRRWSSSEDSLLLSSVLIHQEHNWRAIASKVPLRTPSECAQRWRRLQPHKKREKWSEEEDRRVVQMVRNEGGKWTEIGEKLGGRTGKQVRDRYLNKLDPTINRDRFTEEEDHLIIEGINKYGARWKIIALKIGKRTENMVKNRWHSHIKKFLKKNQPEHYKNLLNIIKTKNKNKNAVEEEEEERKVEEGKEEGGRKEEKGGRIKEEEGRRKDGKGMKMDEEKRIEEEIRRKEEGRKNEESGLKGWEETILMRRQFFWEDLLLRVMSHLQGKI